MEINLSFLHTHSKPVRVKALQDLTEMFESANRESKPGLLKKGTREVLSSIICAPYVEISWKKGLLHLVAVAMGNSSLPFNFPEFCVEIILERFSLHCDAQQLFKTIQLLSMMLNIEVQSLVSRDDSVCPPWCAAAIAVIGSLLDRLSGLTNRPKLLLRAVREVRLLITKRPVLFPLCLIVWNPSSTTASITGLASVMYQCLPEQNEINEEVRTLLYECLLKILNSGSKAPPAGTIYTLSTYIGSITQSQWENDIAPALVRLTKKSPENSAQIVAIVCEAVSGVDVSQFMLDALVTCIPRMLKSANQTTRESTIVTVKHAAIKSADSSALAALLISLLDTLQGKVVGSALSHAYQKESVLAAILNVANSLTARSSSFGGDLNEHINDAITVLLQCMDKEPDDSTRCLQANCAGAFIANTELSSKLCDTFSNFITKRKGTPHGAAYMLALQMTFHPKVNSWASGHAAVISQHSSLLNVLVGIVTDAMKRPNVANVEACLALHVLLEVNKHASVLEGAIDLNRVLSTDAFITGKALQNHLFASYNPSAHITVGMNVLNGAAVVALASIVNIINNIAPQTLSTQSIDTILFCLLFPGRDTAEMVGRVVNDLVFYSQNACGSLLKGLIRSLHEASIDKELHNKKKLENFRTTDNSDGVSVTTSIPSFVNDRLHFGYLPASRLRSALITLISNHGSCRDHSAWPQALYLAGHPYVCDDSAANAQSILKFVQQRFSEGVEEFTSDLEQLVAWATLNNESAATRTAGSNTISLLYNYANGTDACEMVAIHNLEAILDQSIEGGGVHEFSEEEVAVYLDPNYLVNKAIKVVSAGEIKVTNADRKKSSARGTRRGQFGADFTEDEEWAEQVKREKAKKLNEAAGENSPEVEEARRKSAEIVARVEAALAGCLHGLECIGFLAQRRPQLVARLCHRIVPSVMSLARSSLIGQKAVDCLYSLVFNLLDDDMVNCERDIANALRIVAVVIYQPVTPKLTEHQIYAQTVMVDSPLIKAVKELHTIAMRTTSHVSTSNFQIVFPLLKGVLSLKAPIPGCESAFMVLDKFWRSMDKSDFATIRPLLKQYVETCLLVMRGFKISPSPKDTLCSLVSHFEFTPMEWFPMMGVHGVLNNNEIIRLDCAQVMLKAIDTTGGSDWNRNPLMVSRVWLLCHDSNTEVQSIATQIWRVTDMVLSEAFMTSLIPLLSHEDSFVSGLAARAIAGGITIHPHLCQEVIDELVRIFMDALPRHEGLATMAPPDNIKVIGGAVGNMQIPSIRVPVKKPDDLKFSTRVAVAASMQAIGSTVAIPTGPDAERTVRDLLAFILREGVCDEHITVRESMLSTGRSLIDSYGHDHCASIVEILEHTLSSKEGSEDIARFDHRHESAVILLGSAGKHLDKEDPQMIVILESLVTALNTPVSSIQRAVAECLVPLVQVLKTSDHVRDMLENLISQTLNAETYGERRGAAYGVSAFVKGMGIPSIKNHDIVNRLKEFCTTGSVNQRQGALFAFELLSERLGMLFEPYVITIVPLLLKSFSHTSDHVRDAAQEAARVIMSKLSAHGVKQVLTPILASLPTETAWKSKQEALRLLGTMAFCAPRQLATSLPQIIPGLVEACADHHPKVKESAKKSLSDISSVIRNPEVSQLAPTLIAALTEPASKTKPALEALLECEFMHSIDAPSLAILIPILTRALKDRGGDLKRKSAIISGNMCSMISDPKIIVPYLGQVVPGLQDVLLDPIPDIRATCAKALGSIMAGVGEEELSDMVPWLMRTMKGDSSPVERSGAAQGLAEVCLALGEKRIEEILADVMQLSRSASAFAREGLLWLLTFLPSVLGEPFADYISQTLPIVLSGLSDDAEGVRDVSMRAGQVYVSSHGRSHTTEVMDPLLEGMFDEDWRIRESSVSLLGELLYLIGDTKAVGIADGDMDDDDAGLTTGGSSGRVIVTIRMHIGDSTADHVLASLYIARSDNSSTVRQVALQVWKSIVSNTPRTLREIMPSLVQLLIEKLSSESSDQRAVAGRALGELVRKLGDAVLPLVVPYLQRGLDSSDDELRQGVCLGFSEILRAASGKQIEAYVDTLVPALQQALCDDSDHVRSLAAKAFHALIKTIGDQAIESVVPALLESIESNFDMSQADATSSAMKGLQRVVEVKPRDLLEFLLPRLMKSPYSVFSASTLGTVCLCASSSLHYYLSSLVPSLVTELMKAESNVSASAGSNDDDDTLQATFDAVVKCACNVMGAVSTQGVNFLVGELGKEIENESDPLRRKWGALLTSYFFANSKAEYLEYVPVLLKYLLSRSADSEVFVHQAVVTAISALSTAVPVDELVKHVGFIRSCINLTASDAKHRTGRADLTDSEGELILPLFRVPKSLEPILPIFIQAIMHGSEDSRESAAQGIGEIMQMTDAAVLKPFLVKTTGPLIRILGEKFPSSLKFALLETICILLHKGGAGLRAFVPQLQTSFLKALSDPSKQVRTKSASALGQLVALSTRIDPLLNDLCSSATQAESNAIRASFLQAVAAVLDAAGDKASDGVMQNISQTVLACITSEEEQVRMASTEVISALSARLPDVSALIFDMIGLDTSSSSAPAYAPAVGQMVAYGAALRTAGERSRDCRSEAFAQISGGLEDPRSPLVIAACSAIAIACTPPTQVNLSSEEHRILCQNLFSAFLGGLLHCVKGEMLETRRAAVSTIKEMAKHYPEIVMPMAGRVAVALHGIISSNEINVRLKRQAERAMKYILGIRLHGTLDSPLFVGAMENIQSANVDVARFLREYSKKMLTKLSEESDDNW